MYLKKDYLNSIHNFWIAVSQSSNKSLLDISNMTKKEWKVYQDYIKIVKPVKPESIVIPKNVSDEIML